MNIFFTSLFLGFLTFTYSVGGLDYHRCDHAAANIVLTKEAVKQVDTERMGVDAENQNIYIGDFLEKRTVAYYVGRATHRVMNDPRSESFCTAISYSKNCGPVFYLRKFIKAPEPAKDGTYNENLEGSIIVRTTFFGYHYPTEKLYGYSVISVLVNDDDLIFQAVKESIKVYTPNAAGEPVQVLGDDLPSEIIDAISVEHALFYSHDDGHFTVSASCDEDYAWGSYDKDAVVLESEGKYAEKLEKVIKAFDVDTHGIEGRTNPFNYENVKPVSTAFFVGYPVTKFVRNVLEIKNEWINYTKEIEALLQKQAEEQEKGKAEAIAKAQKQPK